MTRQLSRSDRTSYPEDPPFADECPKQYAIRMDYIGHELSWIWNAIAFHFDDFPEKEIFEITSDLDLAKLRYVEMLIAIHPNRTEYSRIKQISRKLGVTEDEAVKWIKRLHDTPSNILHPPDGNA